jgi:4-oxalocrotonate tautomerase
MPVLTIQMHRTTPAQKAELIQELTATAVKVTGIPAPSFVVLIQELEDGAIGLGGRTLAEVKASR